MNIQTCTDDQVRRLREMRAGEQVNMFDLARISGIREARLSLILRGRRPMTADEAVRIEDAIKRLSAAGMTR